MDEAKRFYTDLINQMAFDDKDRLSIFDKSGPYLATKKIGKNNPKAEKIKADNEIRMEWNREVDRAIVSGISGAEIVKLKKTEIADKVRQSVEQNGQKLELFGEIVRAATVLLEHSATKNIQRTMDIAEKAASESSETVREMPKEAESHDHAKDGLAVQPEGKKMPFPFHANKHRKAGVQNKEGQPKPKPGVLARKYPRLKEIDSRLKQQNKAVLVCEKKRDKLKKKLSKCTGIFKGGRRRELQQEIDEIDIQIADMKKTLSSIVKDYKFNSVQTFYKELDVAEKEYPDYGAALTDWEKICGGKAADSMSVRERLRQKEQIVKEREAGRTHQARQKDKGAR